MRRKYLKDFRPDGSGRYVYRGSVFVYADDNALPRRAAIGRLWLFGAVLFAAAVLQGCLPEDGMLNCAYVLVPYCGEVISAGSVLWALVQLGRARDGVREYDYNVSVSALPRRALLSLLFAAAALAGESVYLAVRGVRTVLFTAALFFLLLLACTAAFLLRRFVLTLRWEQRIPSD